MLLRDRVCETTTTTGTGNLFMSGAVTGYLSFAGAGFADGDTFEYSIVAVDANGIPTGQFETGYGTYVSSSTQLARTVPVWNSSGAAAALNFSAGTKRVFVGMLAHHATQLAGKNKLYNPEMQVSQRVGTTSTALAAMSGVTNYSVDRWAAWVASTTSTASTFQQRTSGLTGFKNSIRVGRNSGQTGSQQINLAQVLPSEDCCDLQSAVVVLSFWCIKGANFSNDLNIDLGTGTGTDQTMASFAAGTWTGYSGLTTTISPTTSWKRYATCFAGTALGSTVTQAGVKFYYTPVGTAGADDWFEITGVKLELGYFPTAFEHEPYALAYARCQRYYQTSSGVTACAMPFNTNVSAQGSFPFSVPMRTTPTMILFDLLGASGTCTQLGVANGIAATASQIGSGGFSRIAKTTGTFTAAPVIVAADWTADAEL